MNIDYTETEEGIFDKVIRLIIEIDQYIIDIISKVINIKLV